MLLAAGALPTAPVGKPRLELKVVPVAAGDGSQEAAYNQQGFGKTLVAQTIRLTIYNDSDRPLEVTGPPSGPGTGPWQTRYWGGELGKMEVVPSVLDATGKRVDFEYHPHGTDCLTAPPRTPDQPPPTLGPGESRLLGLYYVSAPRDPATKAQSTLQLGQTDPGVLGPVGEANLVPGLYRIQVALDLQPVTREAWVASYLHSPPASAPAVSGRKGWEARLAKQAEKSADRFKKHWAEVPSFWAGHLDSNVIELEIR